MSYQQDQPIELKCLLLNQSFYLLYCVDSVQHFRLIFSLWDSPWQRDRLCYFILYLLPDLLSHHIT